MNVPIVVAIITAAASLLASAITFSLTKGKEREAEWREIRTDQYKDLLSAMSEVAGSNPPDAARRKLALTSNHVGLFASPTVLDRLTVLLDAISSGQLQRHDEMFSALMHAIRSDLGVPGGPSYPLIKFRLWAPRGQ